MFDKVFNRGSLVWGIIIIVLGIVPGASKDIDLGIVAGLLAISYMVGYYWASISNEKEDQK